MPTPPHRPPGPTALQPDRATVDAIVRRALAEDLTPLGDITSSLLDAERTVEAALVAREEGVLAGARCAHAAFELVEPSIEVAWHLVDGDVVGAGDVVATVRGRLVPVLTAERTALNLLGHLSGIASLTRRYVEAAATAGGARIWDTRKTTPGLRVLEKAAVRAGGGANHRGNLSDWILLKDNHLIGIGIAEAVAAARWSWPGRTVHVECDRLDQVGEALEAGADALLLDNMTTDEVRASVELVSERCAGARRPLVEASGGITLETVADFAAAGVDCISVGAITNAAGVLDIGLDLDGGGATGADR